MTVDEDFTIDDYLEMIESNASTLRNVIEGIQVAMVLKGLSENEMYAVSRFYPTASNIVAYVNGIREILKKKEKMK